LFSLQDMMIQNSALTESPHVVIATPGRLADHIESGTEFFLNKIKFLVRTKMLSLKNSIFYFNLGA
jgi:superfamily II DNA/RNA helicase